MIRCRHRRLVGSARQRAGFTLVELMVSITVLSLMLVLVFQMLDETQKTWARAKGMVSSFKEARDGFEALNRVVGQATLNTYLGYDVFANSSIPQSFERKSELHFVCGPVKELLGNAENRYRVTHSIFFQAPLGFQTIAARGQSSSGRKDDYSEMDTLLNGWGYYVEYSTDKFERPPFLGLLTPPVEERWRYRLMEFRQPAEATTIYQYHLDEAKNPSKDLVWKWFNGRQFGIESAANQDPITSAGEIRTTRIVADNIIALVISPRLAENDLEQDEDGSPPIYRFKEATDIAKGYLYDSREFQYSSSKTDEVRFSRHQIPPVLRITMVAVDEIDVSRFAARTDPTKPPDYAPDDNFFQDVDKYQAHLKQLSESLESIGIRHRVFTSNIRMREGNFSKVF
ncbi:MAG: Verru_Chthon cassette protein C [Verrucomicrobiales bacterium]